LIEQIVVAIVASNDKKNALANQAKNSDVQNQLSHI
jgi:hypothetical protein